jgi:hypothetical protein
MAYDACLYAARLVGLVAGHGGSLVRAWVGWWAGVEEGVRALVLRLYNQRVYC